MKKNIIDSEIKSKQTYKKPSEGSYICQSVRKAISHQQFPLPQLGRSNCTCHIGPASTIHHPGQGPANQEAIPAYDWLALYDGQAARRTLKNPIRTILTDYH